MSELALHAVTSSGKNRKLTFVAVGLAMMAAVMLAPTPTGLSLVGQRVIAVMAFTVFMWITEAIPYGASAVARWCSSRSSAGRLAGIGAGSRARTVRPH